jgi:hypothetical protein
MGRGERLSTVKDKEMRRKEKVACPLFCPGGYQGPLSGTGGLSLGGGADIGAGQTVGLQGTGGLDQNGDLTSINALKGHRGGGGGISVGVDICWTQMLRCVETKCKSQ